MSDIDKYERHLLLRKIAQDMKRINKDIDKIRQGVWLMEKDMNRFLELSNVIEEGGEGDA